MPVRFPGVTIFYSPYSEDLTTSRALLLRAALNYSGLSIEDLGEVAVHPLGKPYFPRQPQIQFSVTHSGAWWMCAFSRDPLGIDLQAHKLYSDCKSLSRRFFHPLEDRYLDQRRYDGFFDLWAAKESWVKYTGRGLYDGTETFSVVSEAGEFPSAPGARLRLLPFADGYSLCLCLPEEADDPVSFLPLE